MMNERRKRVVLILALIVVLCLGWQLWLGVVASRTDALFRYATSVVRSEGDRLLSARSNDDCMRGASVSITVPNSCGGGLHDFNFKETCGSTKEIGRAFRVAFVVRPGLTPMIQIGHSKTEESRDVARRVARALQLVYAKNIDSTPLALTPLALTPAPLMAVQLDFNRGFVFLIRRVVPIVMTVCVIWMAVIFVRSWLESRRRRQLGIHCSSCGYDLRGTPGDRCSECGTLIAERVGRLT